MQIPIYHSGRYEPIDMATIPGGWSEFTLFIFLGVACLFVSAYLAKVNIGSLPINPLRWHLWVIANAKLPPIHENSNSNFYIYRSYILFWAASLCCFIYSGLVFVATIAS